MRIEDLIFCIDDRVFLTELAACVYRVFKKIQALILLTLNGFLVISP